MSAPRARRLRLRAGDTVEVRGPGEILATLDPAGALEGLPFMPEMLAFCGQRFTVAKRADKTCDTVKDSGLRSMTDTVHLKGTRCDGSAHDGCQAACQIFWKEAWLRRVPGTVPARGPGSGGAGVGAILSPDSSEGSRLAALQAGTRRTPAGDGDALYRCQATDLREASRPLPSWWPMQYLRDVWYGNARLGEVVRSVVWVAARYARQTFPGYRIQVWLFNLFQRATGGTPLVDLGGQPGTTPTETLGLVAGELVQVKSLASIRKTLDQNQRNRGLYFDLEMTPFCGRNFVVRSRVSRIINEKTGRMISIPGDCVTLEGAFCTGRFHKCCPRAIYPYWREIWLRRLPESR